MHNPESKPRHSIYYDYKIFPAFSAGKSDGADKAPIVIIGAGPVALTIALNLAKFGVTSVIVEAERQVSTGSRAIVFTKRSMEIFQQVGVSDRIVESGLQWNAGNSFFRGHRVFRMEAPLNQDDRFYPMTNLQQQYVEQFLVEQAEQEPLIEIRWGNKLEEFQQKDDGVLLQVDTPEGIYELEADWLIATDGAKSGIRKTMNLKMEGVSYKGNFVIADIKIDLDLPTERLAFFDPSWSPGNTVLMHREPNSIWRIDYQLPEGMSAEEALQEDNLTSAINAQLEMVGYGDKSWELDWSSVYSARTLTLPDYINGRVIFSGDAAHLLPIFGVRGANTGLQDAQNLGWKLALYHKGIADRSLLDSYTQERVDAARTIISEAGKSTRFMTPPTTGYRLLRDAVLSLSVDQDFVRQLYHWRTSSAHNYDSSPLNTAFSPASDAEFRIQPGEPLQNLKLADGRYLLDLVSGDFVVLMAVSNADVDPGVIAKVSALRKRGVPVCLTVVTEQNADAIEGVTNVISDSDG